MYKLGGRLMEQAVVRTVEELEELPVGSVVLALWSPRPLSYVMQKYSNGWYGYPSDQALYPLGTNDGNGVLVLWRPDDEEMAK